MRSQDNINFISKWFGIHFIIRIRTILMYLAVYLTVCSLNKCSNEGMSHQQKRSVAAGETDRRQSDPYFSFCFAGATSIISYKIMMPQQSELCTYHYRYFPRRLRWRVWISVRTVGTCMIQPCWYRQTGVYRQQGSGIRRRLQYKQNGLYGSKKFNSCPRRVVY